MLTKYVEMNKLSHVRYKFSIFTSRNIIISMHFVDYNPVVIDFSNLIQMAKITKAHFIVKRNEEMFYFA